MTRVEAPRTRGERPSPTFVIQTLQRQTQENKQIVNFNDPQRQLRILIEKRTINPLPPETEEFDIYGLFVSPTPEDLIGK